MPQEGYASAEYTLHQIWKLLGGGGGGATPASFVEVGAANFATGQATVTNVAGIIVTGRATRRAILFINHGATDVFLGTNIPALTAATGVLLTGSEGAAISIPTTAAVYGIVASGTQPVSYIEIYD